MQDRIGHTGEDSEGLNREEKDGTGHSGQGRMEWDGTEQNIPDETGQHGFWFFRR